MEHQRPGNPARRAVHPFTRLVVLLLQGVAALGMLLMTVITFVDVVGRYFMRPLFGAPEMIQILLALTIFAALGLASIRGAHITVDILVPWLRRLFGRGYDFFLHLSSLAGFGLIAWQLGRIALEAAGKERHTIVLEWPLVWFIGPGALLVAFAFYLELVDHTEDQPDSPGEFIN